MKNKLLLVLLAAMAFSLIVPQPVQAAGYIPPAPPMPAAGEWIWDDETVSGTLVPQYQLTPPADDDYATLQSSGVQLSGATQLCHPYRGGQFGWTAEIRMLTPTGWQALPTVNEWVPDEEGQFMTCAQTTISGTYAIFGYWDRPEGWEDRCLVYQVGSDLVNMGPIATYDLGSANQVFHAMNGNPCSTTSLTRLETSALNTPALYCGCGVIYLQTPGE